MQGCLVFLDSVVCLEAWRRRVMMMMIVTHDHVDLLLAYVVGSVKVLGFLVCSQTEMTLYR